MAFVGTVVRMDRRAGTVVVRNDLDGEELPVMPEEWPWPIEEVCLGDTVNFSVAVGNEGSLQAWHRIIALPPHAPPPPPPPPNSPWLPTP